jgi:wyosine [tRNA(Phe)-imidazoG37] synthetase (radical SAM superfamily)
MVRKITDEVIYGPVNSRRLNRSLGINVLPFGEKLCNFNCVYCQYGKTKEYFEGDKSYDFPSLSEIESNFAHYIAGIGEPREYIDYLTLSGNGEPTLHPELPQIIRTLTTIRDEMVPRVSTAILTNGSTLNIDEIRNAIKLLDAPIVKLDCGTEEMFNELNRPAKNIEFDDILKGLEKFKNAIIQTLFITSEEGVDNSTPEEVDKWLKLLKQFDVREVQLYTLDRSPAEKWAKPVSRDKLEEIAKRVEKVLKRPANIY